MKIFVVEGNYPQYNIIDGASLDDKVERPKTAINLLPDTALLMRGRPFFRPRFCLALHGSAAWGRAGSASGKKYCASFCLSLL